jgi:8-oxo-dGTP pyrophosphatase MutT (NUDIX family)
VPEKSWKLLQSEAVSDQRIFRVRHDRYRLETTAAEQDFVVLDMPDWVNVVPVTDDGRIVLVRQYRHGIRRLSLEPPGGVIDPGESPLAAAERELREETGYQAETLQFLGRVAPNPAIQNNWCHLFLARNCRPLAQQRLDRFECIAVETYRPEEVGELLRREEICHAVAVIALGFLGLQASTESLAQQAAPDDHRPR